MAAGATWQVLETTDAADEIIVEPSSGRMVIYMSDEPEATTPVSRTASVPRCH